MCRMPSPRGHDVGALSLGECVPGGDAASGGVIRVEDRGMQIIKLRKKFLRNRTARVKAGGVAASTMREPPADQDFCDCPDLRQGPSGRKKTARISRAAIAESGKSQ